MVLKRTGFNAEDAQCGVVYECVDFFTDWCGVVCLLTAPLDSTRVRIPPHVVCCVFLVLVQRYIHASQVNLLVI